MEYMASTVDLMSQNTTETPVEADAHGMRTGDLFAVLCGVFIVICFLITLTLSALQQLCEENTIIKRLPRTASQKWHDASVRGRRDAEKAEPADRKEQSVCS